MFAFGLFAGECIIYRHLIGVIIFYDFYIIFQFYLVCIAWSVSRGNVVAIATARLSGLSGIRVLVGENCFLFSRTSSLALEPFQLPMQGLSRILFPGVKRPRREVKHFCMVPSLRMSGTIPLLPHCGFVAWTRTTLLVFKFSCMISYRLLSLPDAAID